MQPPPPRAPGLGALLLAFVAGGLGGAAVAVIVSGHGGAGAGAGDSDLPKAIASLERTVAALGERVAATSKAPALPGAPAGAPPIEPLAPGAGERDDADVVAVSQLVSRLDDIAKLLESRAAAGQGFPGSGPLPLLDPTRAPADRSALIALANEENDASRPLWRRHAFWTCQQVIDAYGLPDQIEYGDGSMGWYYDTGQRTIHFVFYEGMLINIWS
jgi:hypothetical protein